MVVRLLSFVNDFCTNIYCPPFSVYFSVKILSAVSGTVGQTTLELNYFITCLIIFLKETHKHADPKGKVRLSLVFELLNQTVFFCSSFGSPQTRAELPAFILELCLFLTVILLCMFFFQDPTWSKNKNVVGSGGCLVRRVELRANRYAYI